MNYTRTAWATAACIISLIALLFEAGTHLCASAFFDPLPDAWHFLAYAFVIVMLRINEWLLGRSWRGRFSDRRREARWLGAGLVGTVFALAVAAMATFMFLPITLFVSWLALLFIGIGVLAWSPPLCLGVLIAQMGALRHRLDAIDAPLPRPAAAASILSVTLALGWFVARPVAIGSYLGDALEDGPQQERALVALRILGGESALLDLAYYNSPSYWEVLGYGGEAGRARDLFFGWGKMQVYEQQATQARRAYYLLTGRPFAMAPRPASDRNQAWSDGRWRGNVAVEETGGEVVGRMVEGLSLSSSRMDGVLDPKTETASVEWTLVFRNETATVQEARAQIALPEGGVVDKVSLWINGQERPAAFGPKAVVREAYRSVAVVQRRDPLLVTATDTGHVLAQCFPVPAYGEMKIRLGVTAPLVWRVVGGHRLEFLPPALDHVNFTLPRRLHHEIWLVEKGVARADGGQWEGRDWQVEEDAALNTRQVSLRLPAAGLAPPPPLYLKGGCTPQVGDRLSPELIRRESPLVLPREPVDLLILIDSVAGLDDVLRNERGKAVASALWMLPPGSRVRLAQTKDSREIGRGWLDSRAAAGMAWWKGLRFVGGVDPAPALVRAWDAARAARNPAAILFLHGGTPREVSQAQALLERFRRFADGPALVGVRLRNGPDALMDQLAGSSRVWALAAPESTLAVGEAVRLAAVAAHNNTFALDSVPLGGRVPAINGVYITHRLYITSGGGLETAPTNRLATFSQVLATWYRHGAEGPDAVAAAAWAVMRRLVTPLSGAVVLETQEQYKQHGLSDGSEKDGKKTVAGVPEPTTLVLVGAGVIALLGARAALFRRRKRNPQTGRMSNRIEEGPFARAGGSGFAPLARGTTTFPCTTMAPSSRVPGDATSGKVSVK